MTQGVPLAVGNGRRFDPPGLTDKLLQPLDDGRPALWHSAFNLCGALGGCVAVMCLGTCPVCGLSADLSPRAPRAMPCR